MIVHFPFESPLALPKLLDNLAYSTKRALNPCWAANCKSQEGLLHCLTKKTNFGKFYGTSRFNAKIRGPQNKLIDKERQFIKKIPNPKRPTKVIQKREMVKIIDGRAFRAFMEGIESNPVCFREFCRNSCTLKEDFTKQEVQNHLHKISKENFDDIMFERLAYNKETKTKYVIREIYTVSDLQEMNPLELEKVARAHLQYKKSKESSRLCAQQDETGRIRRMMCSPCDRHDMPGDLIPACKEFNETVEVDSNSELTEDDIQTEAEIRTEDFESRQEEIKEAEEQHPESKGMRSLLNYPVAIPTVISNFVGNAYRGVRKVAEPIVRRGLEIAQDYAEEKYREGLRYAENRAREGLEVAGRVAQQHLKEGEKRVKAYAGERMEDAQRRAKQHVRRYIPEMPE